MKFSSRILLVLVSFLAMLAALTVLLIRSHRMAEQIKELESDLRVERNYVRNSHGEYFVKADHLITSPNYCVMAINVRTYMPHEISAELDASTKKTISHYNPESGDFTSKIIVAAVRIPEGSVHVFVGFRDINLAFEENYAEDFGSAEAFAEYGCAGAVSSEDVTEEIIPLLNWTNEHSLKISFSLKSSNLIHKALGITIDDPRDTESSRNGRATERLLFEPF
jgi:hypothetical protein